MTQTDNASTKSGDRTATTSSDLESMESFRFPDGRQVVPQEGIAPQVDITSITSVVSQTFDFRENSNTPGRLLEQSVVVNVPSGSGFFVCLNTFTGAFTTSNFQTLTQRPLGQFLVSLGLRGNNFVCQVRLTDSNSDDPISISVRGIVIFFT